MIKYLNATFCGELITGANSAEALPERIKSECAKLTPKKKTQNKSTK
jgi:hypothetical protein